MKTKREKKENGSGHEGYGFSGNKKKIKLQFAFLTIGVIE